MNKDQTSKFILSLDGNIQMEHPNKHIEGFNGVCDFDKYNREAIQVNSRSNFNPELSQLNQDF